MPAKPLSPRRAHRRRPRPAPLWPLVAAAFALLPACQRTAAAEEGAKKPAAPPLVRAVPARLDQVREEIRTTGFLESEHQDQIVSQVSGRIRTLHVDEGQRVTKGQALAEIDDREVQSARQQMVVQRDGKQVDQGLAELEVDSAARRTAQARFELQRAKAEFDRQSAMEQEFVAPKLLEDAQLAFQTAEEAVKVAEFGERKASLEVTRIANLIAELDARIAELDVRIDNHLVRAPFDGVVTRRYVVEGAIVGASTPLFDLIDPVHLVAYLDRPQSELALVRKAREVSFTTDALRGREFTADVDLVSPVIDRQTGHFRLRVRVRKADAAELVHGMFVRARIHVEEMREALLVPKSAVLSEGDVAVVMVVRGDKAYRIDLDPGLELDQWVETRNRGENGIAAGDLVIVEGQEDLKDQSDVRVAQ